jgi:hypothetical protein
MTKPFIFPGTLEGDDKVMHDQFTWYETLCDSTMVVALGLVCGFGGTTCVGWGWHWRIVLGIFFLGGVLMVCEHALLLFHDQHADTTAGVVEESVVEL